MRQRARSSDCSTSCTPWANARGVVPRHLRALRGCVLFCECVGSHDRHYHVVAYSSDLTDAHWNLLEPLLVTSSKRGPKHGDDLRHVVDAMLYVSHTGCQWRFLPDQFGPWTRVWSQFRRWSRNETGSRVLASLHASSRTALGRREAQPSMVVIDTHLARGASNSGATFHDQGGPYGRTNGARRIVCVDVTGLALCVRVVRLDVRSTGRRTHTRRSLPD